MHLPELGIKAEPFSSKEEEMKKIIENAARQVKSLSPVRNEENHRSLEKYE